MATIGKFLTFEGGEGSGKSTHIDRLIGRLRSKGYSTLTTREPGGTEIGEQIRHILQYSKHAAGMTPEAELLLFCASRAQIVREVIQPGLDRGQMVISDRFFDSTTVYQGVGRGLDPDILNMLNRFVISTCMPDLTILIDIEPQIGLERARGRELFDRMESLSLDFHERVRRGYLDLAKREPNRIKVVDGNREPEIVHDEIWNLVINVLT